MKRLPSLHKKSPNKSVEKGDKWGVEQDGAVSSHHESNCFMNSDATVRPLELMAIFIALISLSMSSMNCEVKMRWDKMG